MWRGWKKPKGGTSLFQETDQAEDDWMKKVVSGTVVENIEGTSWIHMR